MKRSLRSWLWRVPLQEEIEEELALHLEMRTRELVERGMDPDAARAVLPLSDTSVGPVHDLAGARALRAPPPPPPVKKHVLWAVLVGAVVLLGVAAARLIRQER